VVSGFVPLVEDLGHEIHGAREAVLERGDYAFEALGIDHRLDAGRVVAHQVVVQFDASRFLLLNHDVSNLQEDAFHP